MTNSMRTSDCMGIKSIIPSYISIIVFVDAAPAFSIARIAESMSAKKELTSTYLAIN